MKRTWRGSSITWDPEGYERKAMGMGISLHGGKLGKLEWAPLAGTLGDGRKWLWRWISSLSVGAL